MSSINNIIAKINKIKALAGNNPSEHERARATEMVNALMAQYNISLVQLHQNNEEIGSEYTDIETHNWQNYVCSAVAKLYYVKYFRNRNAGQTRYHAAFIGTPTNRAAAINIAEWLIAMIIKEAKDTFVYKTDQNDFADGAAIRIWERASEIQTSQQKGLDNHIPNTTQNELMVVRNALESANQQWADQNLHLRGGRGIKLSNTIATHAGREYGNGLGLSYQITGKSTKRIEKKQ